MSVISYLAIPHQGKLKALTEKLLSLQYCEIIESDSKEILILVTETQSQQQDEEIFSKINQLEEIQLLQMVFGHDDQLKIELNKSDAFEI